MTRQRTSDALRMYASRAVVYCPRDLAEALCREIGIPMPEGYFGQRSEAAQPDSSMNLNVLSGVKADGKGPVSREESGGFVSELRGGGATEPNAVPSMRAAERGAGAQAVAAPSTYAFADAVRDLIDDACGLQPVMTDDETLAFLVARLRPADAQSFSPSTACADAMRAADRWRKEYDELHVAYCELAEQHRRTGEAMICKCGHDMKDHVTSVVCDYCEAQCSAVPGRESPTRVHASDIDNRTEAALAKEADNACKSCETRPASPWCNGCIVEDYQAACGCEKCIHYDTADRPCKGIAVYQTVPGAEGQTFTPFRHAPGCLTPGPSCDTPGGGCIVRPSDSCTCRQCPVHYLSQFDGPPPKVSDSSRATTAVSITYFKPSGKYYTTDENVYWPEDKSHYTGWAPFRQLHRIKGMIAVCMGENPLGFPQLSPPFPEALDDAVEPFTSDPGRKDKP